MIFNLGTKNRIPETEPNYPIPEPKYPNRSGLIPSSVPVSEYPKYPRVIRFQASGNRISRIFRICFIIHMCVRCCLLFSVQPVLFLYVCELPVVQPWRLICVWAAACCAACATVILLCVCATLMFVVWNVAWLWLWNVPCYVHAKGGKMLSKFTFEWAVSLFFF
jgi:hypothetical protein